MGLTRGPPGACRPHMSSLLVLWILLSGLVEFYSRGWTLPFLAERLFRFLGFRKKSVDLSRSVRCCVSYCVYHLMPGQFMGHWDVAGKCKSGAVFDPYGVQRKTFYFRLACHQDTWVTKDGLRKPRVTTQKQYAYVRVLHVHNQYGSLISNLYINSSFSP